MARLWSCRRREAARCGPDLRTRVKEPFVLASWPSVPVEIVRAAGFRAVFARGASDPTPAADQHLEPGIFPPRLRHLVESALTRRLSDAARIVIPRTSDTDYKCFLYLREFVRRGVMVRGSAGHPVRPAAVARRTGRRLRRGAHARAVRRACVGIWPNTVCRRSPPGDRSSQRGARRCQTTECVPPDRSARHGNRTVSVARRVLGAGAGAVCGGGERRGERVCKASRSQRPTRAADRRSSGRSRAAPRDRIAWRHRGRRSRARGEVAHPETTFA